MANFTPEQLKNISSQLNKQYWWDMNKAKEAIINQYWQDWFNKIQWAIQTSIKQANTPAPWTWTWTWNKTSWVVNNAAQTIWQWIRWQNPEGAIEPVQPLQAQSFQKKQTNTPQQQQEQEVNINEVVKPKWQNDVDNILQKIDINKFQETLQQWLQNWILPQKEYDQIQKYLWEQAIQKQTEQQPVSSDELFNNINSWWPTSDNIKNTPEYQKQLERYNRLMHFNKMSPNDLAQAINWWQLVPWSETYNDLARNNPWLLQQAESFARFSNALIPADNQVSKTSSIQETLSDIITAMMSPNEVQDLQTRMANDTELINYNNEIWELENEMKEVKREIDNVYRDVQKELEWKMATSSYTRALASRRSEDLVREYNSLQDKYNTVVWKLNRRTEMLSYDMQAEEKARQEETEQLKLLYWITRDELNHERELEAEKRARQYKLEDIQTARKQELENKQIDFAMKKYFDDIDFKNKKYLTETQWKQWIEKMYLEHWLKMEVADENFARELMKMDIWKDNQFEMMKAQYHFANLQDINKQKLAYDMLEYKNVIDQQNKDRRTSFVSLWNKTNLVDMNTWEVIKEFDIYTPPEIMNVFNSLWWWSIWWWFTTWWTWFRDLTNEIRRPQGSINVWQDTNNPWNIMAETESARERLKELGAIWFYKSPNWRTYGVFPDMQTWLNAMKLDIKAKLNWWSFWVNDNTTLWQLAFWWTAGPNAKEGTEVWKEGQSAITNFEKILWASRFTPIKNIPQDKLIDAIIKNEWVNINKSTDLSYLTQQWQTWQWEYTASQKAVMDAFLEKPTDTKSFEALQIVWLTMKDIDNYKTNTIETIDNKSYNPNFTHYYKQLNTWAKLNATETKMLAEAFGDIWEFHRQAKIYWQELAVSRALPQLNDLQKDLEYLKNNYSFTNMASLQAWVGSYYAVWNNIRNKQAFQELLRLKENWATFGALTEKEFENIKFSTEVWKLNITAGRDTWNMAIDRMIRDVYFLQNEIQKGNNSINQNQTSDIMQNEWWDFVDFWIWLWASLWTWKKFITDEERIDKLQEQLFFNK